MGISLPSSRIAKLAALAVSAAMLLGSRAGAAAPSFDCGRAVNALARTICADGDASGADWQLVSAYWAIYATLEGADRIALRDGHVAWLKNLDAKCGLVLGDQSKLKQQAPCVSRYYRTQADTYRRSLSGDAAAETRLTPDDHKAIQRRLIELGYANQGEGVFGASTRQAIRAYQASLGQAASGFLSTTQTSALLSKTSNGRATAEAHGGNQPRSTPGPDQDAAAAQAMILGIFGGMARSQGLPIPLPPRTVMQPPFSSEGGHMQAQRREGARDYNAPSEPSDRSVDSRFGGGSSVTFDHPSSAPRPTTDALRTVEVTGTGETVETARDDASRLAVQKVAGLYVDARRRVESKITDTHVSDVVEEKIVSYTNAYVKKLEILGTVKKGDLVEVRASVSVAVAPLVKILQDNAVPTIAVDTDTTASTAESLAKEKQGAIDIYSDLITRSSNLVTVGVGKAEIDTTLPSGADAAWLSIPITYTANDGAVKEWRQKFDLIANQRASVDLRIVYPNVNNGSREKRCPVPVYDMEFVHGYGPNRTFVGEQTQGSERGAAACFLDSTYGGIAHVECLGRKFVVNEPSYNPCKGSGPCLFLRPKTQKVTLVIDMLDKTGARVFRSTTTFQAFPAINVSSSSTSPIGNRTNFFNYCIPGQTLFFGEGVKEEGAQYGDVLILPSPHSQIRAYYNQLLPNEKIARIASISAKLVPDIKEVESQ